MMITYNMHYRYSVINICFFIERYCYFIENYIKYLEIYKNFDKIDFIRIYP